MTITTETWLTLQCQWCNTVYGKKPGHGVSGLSHGICSACCADCGAKVGAARLNHDGICTACAAKAVLQ